LSIAIYSMKLSGMLIALASAASDAQTSYAQLMAQHQSSAPTMYPTASPTKYPTKYPTSSPTKHPTTAEPTFSPTANPTAFRDMDALDDPNKSMADYEGCTVKLYKNCFYEGYVGTFGHGQQIDDLGKTVKEQGEQDGVLQYAFNNDISSIKIEGQCAIYLYDGKHFGGEAKVLTQSAPCLVQADASLDDKHFHTNYFNDKVSSFKVASMYMDPVGLGAEIGNKWVSREDYDKRVVVVKNTPYLYANGDKNVLYRFQDLNDYPEHLDYRQRYTLARVDGTIGNDSVDGSLHTFLGENLEFAYNGQTARLMIAADSNWGDLDATCRQQTHERIYYANGNVKEAFKNPDGNAQGCKVMIVDANHNTEIPAFLNGNQMSWKKDANHGWRAHSSDQAQDCFVEIFDTCADDDDRFPTDAGYTGTSDYKAFKFYAGHYDHIHTVGGEKQHIDVAAVRISGDCKLRMYDDLWFGGEERIITTNQYCMSHVSLQTEFESQVYSHMIVNGIFKQEALLHHGSSDMKFDQATYDKHGLTATTQRKADRQFSLRVNSLELVHYTHPTPYPTAFPTAEPTFHLDMPRCPLYCTYQNDHGEKFDVNKGHILNVIHNRTAMSDWSAFRAQYSDALAGRHECWHEQPGGQDEMWDSPDTHHNHADHGDFEASAEGGCHCRCS